MSGEEKRIDIAGFSKNKTFECSWSLYLGLAFYALAVFLFIQYLSVTRNGHEHLLKTRFVIWFSCAFFIEVLNQITYWLNKKNERSAVLVRVVVFWVIFTAGAAVYIMKLYTLNANLVFNWHREMSSLVIQLVVCAVLPAYSMIPKFRLLFLKGSFKK